MRAAIFLAACSLVWGQSPDPGYEWLTRAYAALQARDYDAAIAAFEKGIEAGPPRAAVRRDLAYAYLKIGENERARVLFAEAMALDTEDVSAALEYAFLCFESGKQAEARGIFDRIRRSGNQTAEEAFQNIDRPLAQGIAQWKAAIAAGADQFSAHLELAKLAQQRDEAELAAEHFEAAWRRLPDRRSVLVELGRSWRRLGRADDAAAALLAASRGGEPYAAEEARELLPVRYPYVAEFRRALALDPANQELRRELAYLLLRMERQAEAEAEFEYLTRNFPADLLAATQLGFLLHARGERAAAQVLFERVLEGNDEELANRVRAVLRLPQVLRGRSAGEPDSIDAKVMAERSIRAGYMKDALRYLQAAHEADPGDFEVMLRLGWTLNILRNDREAFRWFDLARRAPDAKVAGEALRAWRGLRAEQGGTGWTGWWHPVISSRWRDVFSYGQVRLKLPGGRGLRPYLSTRFVGDARRSVGGSQTAYLSESAVIAGAGVALSRWPGVTLWGEAGWSHGYLTGEGRPDFRAGISVARGIGTAPGGGAAGWFAEAALDGVYLSRFNQDFLMYDQVRVGYTAGLAQFSWNTNLTVDVRAEPWANFVEGGPGVRVMTPFLAQSSWFSLGLLRGAYLIGPPGGRLAEWSGRRFTDVRVGYWYAFSR